MRTIKVILLTSVLILTASAQSKDSTKAEIPSIDIQPQGLDYSKKTDKPQEDSVYFVADQMPEPIGGIKEIQERIKYPTEAKIKGIEGKVYILVVVDDWGDVEEAQVLEGIGGGCDEAALKAVKETKFIPGKDKGKYVKVQVAIPIVFKL